MCKFYATLCAPLRICSTRWRTSLCQWRTHKIAMQPLHGSSNPPAPVFSYSRPADQPADPFVSDPTRRLQPPLRLLKQIDPILLIRRGSILELRHQRHRKTETHSIPPVIVQLKRTGAGAEINPTSAHEQLHFKLRHTASSR